MSTLAFAAALLGAPSAQAAVTAKDVQVAGRVLGFMNPPPAGALKLGIVYDPANPVSLQDERSMAGILGNGLNIAGITLVPEPVPVASLPTAKADILFMTGGLSPAAASAVRLAAAARNALCLTTDLAATRNGSCAVGIASSPTVQITVNKSALAASGLSFTTAFLLMVTEI